MADEIKRVGIELTAEGAKDFAASMKEVQASTKEAYTELKLAQSQYDKNTSVTQKLADRQKYLQSVTEQYTKKQEILRAELKDLESAEERDETAIAKKRAELNQCTAKLNDYKSGLEKANNEIKSHSAQLKEWGEKLGDIGGKVKGAGEALTKGVTAPIAAVGAASVAAWKEVDEAMDTVTTKTGASGKALEDMQQRAKNIAETIPTSFQTAADAVGEVNTRFGATGEELEDLSTKFVQFAELNETDVSSSIDSVQSAMAAWGVETKDAGLMLDMLNKAGQDTGVSVDKLSDMLKANKTAMSEMGFTVSDSAKFLANLDKNGVDAGTAITGLRKALQNATKDGKTSKQALDELQQKMGEGTSKTDAYAAAVEVFGAKAGPAIADAVREGRISFEELGTSLEEYAGNVENTFNETLDPLDQLQVSMNTAKDLGAEIVEAAAPMIVEAMTMIRDGITSLKEKWDGLDENQQQTIIKIAGIAAAVGPLLLMLGTVIGVVSNIVSGVAMLSAVIGAPLLLPIAAVVAAITAAIAIGVLLYKNWDTITAKAGEMAAGIKQKWEDFKSDTAQKFQDIKDGAVRKVEELKTAAIDKARAMKEGAVQKFEELKTAAVDKARALKEGTVQKIQETKDSVTQKIQEMKDSATRKIEELKSGATSKFDAVKQKAKTTFEETKKAITDPINNAKETVQSAISRIEGLFSRARFKFPSIKTPHFSWDWINIGGIVSVPSIHVNWYKRGYTDPVLFKSPTVLATSSGLKGFGDGPANDAELTYSRNALLSDIEEAVSHVVGNGARQIAPVVNININVYTQPEQDPEEIAQFVARRMEQEFRRTGAAWA